MHRTIISFVQPQPNSIQNKNNPIGCGTAPGNLHHLSYQLLADSFCDLVLTQDASAICLYSRHAALVPSVVIGYKSVVHVVPAIIVFTLVSGQEEIDRTTQSKSVEELVDCIVLHFNKVHPLSLV